MLLVIVLLYYFDQLFISHMTWGRELNKCVIHHTSQVPVNNDENKSR